MYLSIPLHSLTHSLTPSLLTSPNSNPLPSLLHSTHPSFGIKSKITLPPHNLSSINSLHLIHPSSGRNNLAHSPHLVRRIARDADVVAALEHVLDVADVELRAVA